MKNLNLQNEQGRSMVEMLGVLAVIGVLSVMGIAGYTQAMKSYRGNEIVNATSMLYMMGISANGGNGVTQPLAYSDAFGGTPPTGASALTYNANGTISLTISDADICADVKNKLGSKVTEGECQTSGNSTLTVMLGEASGGITSSPWYKANCSMDDAPCYGNGYSCSNTYGRCYCYNGAYNPPDCDDEYAQTICNHTADYCIGDTYACCSGGCQCLDSSETYPTCTKKPKCLTDGKCHYDGYSSVECFDSTKTPPDCE